VLFLFVIMLLNLQEEPVAFAPSGLVAVAVAAGIGLAIAVTVGLVRTSLPSATLTRPFGGTEPLAERLFTTYLLPFELTSVLLLVAIIGAVVLGKKRLP
jgi:NADH-quinone oxidoreductase subunit J